MSPVLKESVHLWCSVVLIWWQQQQYKYLVVLVLTNIQMDYNLLVPKGQVRTWTLVPRSGWEKTEDNWNFLKCFWKGKEEPTFCCCRHFVHRGRKIVCLSQDWICQSCRCQLDSMTFSKVACQRVLCHTWQCDRTMHCFPAGPHPYLLKKECILKARRECITCQSRELRTQMESSHMKLLYTLIHSSVWCICLCLYANTYIHTHMYSAQSHLCAYSHMPTQALNVQTPVRQPWFFLAVGKERLEIPELISAILNLIGNYLIISKSTKMQTTHFHPSQNLTDFFCIEHNIWHTS